MKPPYISVIIPVYGCCNSLNELYQRLNSSLKQISNNYEIILINDASPDDAWEQIKFLAQNDSRVKGINLSRNFGQHYAITAGLDFVQSDWTVVMDCDLQDQPEEILKLYNKAQDGFDVVVGKRILRKDHFLKRMSSKLFYLVYNYLTDANLNSEVGNFGIYSKKVITAVKQFKEQNRSFGLFVIWTGFKRVELNIKHASRKEGKTSYTFTKLINLAIDSIIAHSNKPLKLSVKLGFSISFISLLYSVWLVINHFIYSSPIEGWTSLIVSLYFLSGLIIGSIGMLGLYVGKIFDEVKKRPLYIIQELTFNEND